MSYRAAIESRPGWGEAWWNLANLKTYRFSDGEIGRMRALDDAPATTSADRSHLCFALGKALEDRADYESSWSCYERGNALKHAEMPYDPTAVETHTEHTLRACTPEFFAARAGWGAATLGPIFILGLPRSGSTLIEQILASHSQVEGTHELPDIPRFVSELRGGSTDTKEPRYPKVLIELAQEDVRQLGERYMADTRIYRKTERPYFIDKLPDNFLDIGLIQLILPNAIIIDARREPLACCFSNFKQLYSAGQAFTYSMGDLARYYRNYLKIMRHWNAVLPDRILTVQHEDLVADLEGQVRRILSFCALPFEPACLKFHTTRRHVHTASSEQVRRPLSVEGIDQWRRYEAWLRPLKEGLGEALSGYRE